MKRQYLALPAPDEREVQVCGSALYDSASRAETLQGHTAWVMRQERTMLIAELRPLWRVAFNHDGEVLSRTPVFEDRVSLATLRRLWEELCTGDQRQYPLKHLTWQDFQRACAFAELQVDP